MDVVGDDQQALVVDEGTGHLFRRGADVDEQRAVVGDEPGSMPADHHLLCCRHVSAGLIGEILDARGEHGAAMGSGQ